MITFPVCEIIQKDFFSVSLERFVLSNLGNTDISIEIKLYSCPEALTKLSLYAYTLSLIELVGVFLFNMLKKSYTLSIQFTNPHKVFTCCYNISY